MANVSSLSRTVILSVSLDPRRCTSSTSNTLAMGMEIYSQYGEVSVVGYFDVVALVSAFEEDFLELFDPLTGTCGGIGSEMVDSVHGVEVESFVLFIFVVHLCVQGVSQINVSTGEIQVLTLVI
jgi:hypothetical protein